MDDECIQNDNLTENIEPDDYYLYEEMMAYDAETIDAMQDIVNDFKSSNSIRICEFIKRINLEKILDIISSGSI